MEAIRSVWIYTSIRAWTRRRVSVRGTRTSRRQDGRRRWPEHRMVRWCYSLNVYSWTSHRSILHMLLSLIRFRCVMSAKRQKCWTVCLYIKVWVVIIWVIPEDAYTIGTAAGSSCAILLVILSLFLAFALRKRIEATRGTGKISGKRWFVLWMQSKKKQSHLILTRGG